MVSAPRCPPGARGLLALLLLLPLPGARGQCGSPPRLSFAEVTRRTWSRYPVGFGLSYSCRPGYTLASGKSPVVICDADSTWSVDPEFCVGKPCKPLELKNGRVDLTNFRFGETANFSCSEGYKLIGPTSAQCVLEGNGVDWNKEVPLCKAISCRPPPDITHGSHNALIGEEFFVGLKVTYKCDPGFSLIGEASIHCTTKDNVNGEWSGPAPACKVGCLKAEVQNGNLLNALDEKMWYSVNETIPFKCSPGYQVSSHSHLPATDRFSITCLADGSWTALPKCNKQSTSDVCEMVPESREFKECGVPLETLRTLLEVQKLYLEIEKLKQELKSQ
ncbi:C4b-binding protein alpha chain-like [Terrapene carolina triunguis]|uniref:C4b-binding protein alpha chain-like n=1 Tax=Terrapene triunguis TaxID=2587831 RepID=UPI000E77C4DE|nr:C4b-binding protein alpha chain-like [Terrapene carolina triunguis]